MLLFSHMARLSSSVLLLGYLLFYLTDEITFYMMYASKFFLSSDIYDVPQTGSGKTYTMGTGCRDGSHTGIIPLVMNALFSKIDALKHQVEFQLRVSFIEVKTTLSLN